MVTQTLPTPCANEGGGAGAEVVVVVVEEEEEKKIKLINSARTTVLGLACRALQVRGTSHACLVLPHACLVLHRPRRFDGSQPNTADPSSGR